MYEKSIWTWLWATLPGFTYIVLSTMSSRDSGNCFLLTNHLTLCTKYKPHTSNTMYKIYTCMYAHTSDYNDLENLSTQINFYCLFWHIQRKKSHTYVKYCILSFFLQKEQSKNFTFDWRFKVLNKIVLNFSEKMILIERCLRIKYDSIKTFTQCFCYSF